MAGVTLGTFFSSNGKTVMGGAGGSGIDTQSLITSLTTAMSTPATNDQTKITANTAQITALNSFQTLLSTFQSAATALSNPAGVGNASNNAFQYMATNLTTNTGVTGANYVSVTAAPGAAAQSYSISNITSLASAQQQSTGNFSVASADASVVSATPTAGQFTAGQFTVNGQTITLSAGDSLNTIAADFNSVKGTTGISATVVQVSSGNYQLSFAATKSGTANSFDFNSSSTLTDTSGVFTNVLSSPKITTTQPATNAVFDFNNVQVTRSSNTVTDLVNGLTIGLNQTTASAPSNTQINVAISPDPTMIQNSIVNFVNAYNAIQTFAAQQTQLNSDGTYATTAVLHNNQAFNSIMASVNTEVNSKVSGITGSSIPKDLADLGITFTDQAATSTAPAVSNILNVNDTALSTAIASNPSGVANVFQFNFTSSNSNVAIYSRTNALAISNFSLNINPATSTYTATYTDANKNTQTTNLTATAIKDPTTGLPTGYSLTGASGSVLDGLVLLYASTAAGTANITATQGIADKVANTTTVATTATTGTIANAISSITTANTGLQTDITKINAQVETYTNQLLNQLSAMEAAISKVNYILASLTANQNAQLVASGH